MQFTYSIFSGLNIRHLGLVYAASRQERTRRLLLGEMVARAIKDQIHRIMRRRMRELAAISEEPFIRVVVDTFRLMNTPFSHPVLSTFYQQLSKSSTLLIFSTQEGKIFWQEVLEDLKIKFPTVPTVYTRREYEIAITEPSRSITLEDIHRIRGVALLERVLHLVGVKLLPESREELRAHPDTFTLVPSDIEEIQARYVA